MRTWTEEFGAVAIVLGAVVVATGAPAVEWLGASAVLASFGHAQVSDRMAEQEAARAVPSVPCFRRAQQYFLTKEVLWCAYFVSKGAWSALVGCGVFLAYPAWRAWYRKRRPVSPDRGAAPEKKT